MRKASVLVFFGSVCLVATAPQCGNGGTTDCTQTSTCPSDASDGPPPVVCDMTKDPKDSPGCLDDRVGIFVSPTGADGNPGTKEMPVQTIGKALTIVGTLTRVYVCEGTYAEDVLLGPPGSDGISIYGAFKCADWSYTGNKPTVGKTNAPLKITGTTKPIAIQDFLVQAANGSPTSSSSIAAFVANAASVTFTRVNLTAGTGAGAADGAAGSNYSATLLLSDPSIAGHNASGATGGTLQMCTGLCTDSTASTGGQGGVGGAAPGDGSDGAPTNLGGGLHGVHTSACNSGGSGGNGGNATATGADAVSPTKVGSLAAAGWAASGGGNGSNGAIGQGGGGGAGQNASGAGGGAGGGCGGCGGGGGVGGGGGGGSIALAVFTSTVVLNASELHASAAGNGGKGSAGQVGQGGGYSGNQSNPGCTGGNGGTGSAGGTSAGGAGGVSVGVVYSGPSPTIDQATQGAITFGTAGTKGVGGKAGTNDGIDGVAMATLQSP